MSLSTTRVHIEEELLRLENSRMFSRSTSQLRLLRFLLERGAADPESLREPLIGRVFYGRPADYDTRDDSIVRVNVNRLRQRLQEYYEGEGEGNPGRISMPRGSYVPSFSMLQSVEEPEGTTPVVAGEASLIAEPQGLTAQPEAPPIGAEIARVAALAGRPMLSQGWLRVLMRRSVWLLAAVCVVFVAAFAGATRHHRVPSRAPLFLVERLSTEPLTSGKFMAFEPAQSKDGKHFAYVREDSAGHGFHIWLRDAGGSESTDRLLDTGSESAFYPAWSPDAVTISFLRCGHRPCEVATIAATGGPVRTVRTLPRYTVPDDQPYYQYRQLSPTWTSDGRSLIYPYRGENDTAELLVMQNLHSGNVEELLTGVPGDEDGAPSVSPDGRSVAFLRRHLTKTDVSVLELDSRQVTVLQTVPNVTSSGLSWSTDGSGVIVGMNEQKGLLLRWLPLHGTPREMPGSMLSFMNPVFGADGRSLMVLNVNRTRNLTEVSGSAGAPTPVFQSRQRNYSTTFSPDGKELAFLSDRSGRVEVWKARRLGTDFVEPTQLTHGLPWFPSSLVWSPDGRTLAVGVANSHRIDLVNAHSGQMRTLSVPGLERSVLWSPCWTADSQSILASAAGEQNGIFRIAANGAPSARQLMFGNAREVRIDGDRAIYFTPAYGKGIRKLRLEDGAVPELVPALSEILPARAWVVRSGHLFYLNVWDNERKLHSYDLTSGRESLVSRPLLRPVFGDSSIAYLPEQQLLLFSQWTEAAGSQIFDLHW